MVELALNLDCLQCYYWSDESVETQPLYQETNLFMLCQQGVKSYCALGSVILQIRREANILSTYKITLHSI